MSFNRHPSSYEFEEENPILIAMLESMNTDTKHLMKKVKRIADLYNRAVRLRESWEEAFPLVRKTAERICMELCDRKPREEKKLPKSTLDDFLRIIGKEIPKPIELQLRALQNLSNLGVHEQDLSDSPLIEKCLQPCLSALKNVFAWYVDTITQENPSLMNDGEVFSEIHIAKAIDPACCLKSDSKVRVCKSDEVPWDELCQEGATATIINLVGQVTFNSERVQWVKEILRKKNARVDVYLGDPEGRCIKAGWDKSIAERQNQVKRSIDMIARLTRQWPDRITLRLLDMDFKYSMFAFAKTAIVTFHPFNQDEYVPETLLTFVVPKTSLFWKRFFQADIEFLERKGRIFSEK